MTKEQEIAQVISLTLKSYNKTAMYYMTHKRFEDAIKKFQDSLKLQEIFKHKRGIAETNYNIASAFICINKLSEAKNYLEKSKTVFEELVSDKDLFYVNMALANIALLEKNEQAAFKHFEECTKSELFKQSKELLEHLCVFYIKENNYQKSIQMNLLKLKHIKLTKLQQADTNIQLAIAYQHIHDYKSALNCLKNSLLLLDNPKQRDEVLSAISSISTMKNNEIIADRR